MATLSQLTSSNSKKDCPLCGANKGHFYYEDKWRAYYQCGRCDLVYVPKQYWLTEAAEKVRYDQHENNIEDQGYRQFLARIVDPLVQNLPTEQPKKDLKGLDFGSGPGPALAIMLQDLGYKMAIFDKFYQPDKSVLNTQYDFITSTEVVEHLQAPNRVLQQLWAMLKAKGVLAIMTKRVIDLEAFKNWHYKNDDTHIVFFSKKTFHFLAEQWQSKAQFFGNDVVVFKKN